MPWVRRRSPALDPAVVGRLRPRPVTAHDSDVVADLPKSLQVGVWPMGKFEDQVIRPEPVEEIDQ